MTSFNMFLNPDPDDRNARRRVVNMKLFTTPIPLHEIFNLFIGSLELGVFVSFSRARFQP